MGEYYSYVFHLKVEVNSQSLTRAIWFIFGSMSEGRNILGDRCHLRLFLKSHRGRGKQFVINNRIQGKLELVGVCLRVWCFWSPQRHYELWTFRPILSSAPSIKMICDIRQEQDRFDYLFLVNKKKVWIQFLMSDIEFI